MLALNNLVKNLQLKLVDLYSLEPKIILEQFSQLEASGIFRKYDYMNDNLKIYGSPSPPEYRLRLITAPTFLYHQAEDFIVTLPVSIPKILIELGKNRKFIHSLYRI